MQYVYEFSESSEYMEGADTDDGLFRILNDELKRGCLAEYLDRSWPVPPAELLELVYVKRVGYRFRIRVRSEYLSPRRMHTLRNRGYGKQFDHGFVTETQLLAEEKLDGIVKFTGTRQLSALKSLVETVRVQRGWQEIRPGKPSKPAAVESFEIILYRPTLWKTPTEKAPVDAIRLRGDLAGDRIQYLHLEYLRGDWVSLQIDHDHGPYLQQFTALVLKAYGVLEVANG